MAKGLIAISPETIIKAFEIPRTIVVTGIHYDIVTDSFYFSAKSNNFPEHKEGEKLPVIALDTTEIKEDRLVLNTWRLQKDEKPVSVDYMEIAKK